MGRVVLGDEADEETGPETAGDASEHITVEEGGGDGSDSKVDGA